MDLKIYEILQPLKYGALAEFELLLTEICKFISNIEIFVLNGINKARKVS